MESTLSIRCFIYIVGAGLARPIILANNGNLKNKTGMVLSYKRVSVPIEEFASKFINRL